MENTQYCITEDQEEEAPKEVVRVTWENPTAVNLLVTLYKDMEGIHFKKKEYLFVLEDAIGPTRRKLAIFPCDMAEYVSMDYDSQPLDLELKPLSNKVSSVHLGVQVRCEFVKCGKPRDTDMESNFSHVSDEDEELRRMTLSFDDETLNFEFECPIHDLVSNVAVVQRRAAQTKSQIVSDLELAEKRTMATLQRAALAESEWNRQHLPATPINQETKEELVGNSDRTDVTLLAHSQPNGLDQYSSLSNVHSGKSSAKPRRRLSAKVDNRIEKSSDKRKASTTSLVRVVKTGFRAVFLGRKERLATLRDDLLPGSEALKAHSLPGGNFPGAIRDDDAIYRHTVKERELQEQNDELRIKNEALENEVATLQKDVDDLQNEVGELQLLVEDLRSKLFQAEATQKEAEDETKELFLKMELRGWLCKRGVKGGPIGKRWQRRWFAVDANGRLYYYKGSNNSTPRGFIDLDSILCVEDVSDFTQDKNHASFNVIVDGRVYELMAHDEDEKYKWINALDYIRSWRAHMLQQAKTQ